MCVVPLLKNKAVGFIELSNAELKYIYISLQYCTLLNVCLLIRAHYIY